MKICRIFLIVSIAVLGCSRTTSTNSVIAITGATLITASGPNQIIDGVLLIDKGKILAVGSKEEVKIPDGAQIESLAGKFIMPGMINAHGHIGGTSLLSASYSKENVIRDLKNCAYYGVTTVYSLGGDEEASVEIRDQQDTLDNAMARLFIAGDVITGTTPEEARALVDKNASRKVDVIKIRVDDNLGTSEKMKPEIYEAIIDQAKLHGLPVAAHIFYLEDAKAMIRLGVRMIAHSVRDVEVDEEFIRLMKESGAYYCPTLMREVSTFIYESEPSFFNDPFFLARADSATVTLLKDPARQLQVQQSRSAQQYKIALDVARKNLKILADAGIPIVFGTDTGPPGRFHGYFEHMELEEMVKAGMTPEEVIETATVIAASSLDKNHLGALESGRDADFIVLEKNPMEDITNSRSIEAVWINGKPIKRN